MDKTKLSASIERVLKRMVDELQQEGIKLNHIVSTHMSDLGMRATVHLIATPINKLHIPAE